MDTSQNAGDKLKVFISYSRANVGWADQILELLEDKGFDAILDRHDIVPGEPWEERLGNLLFECDKVVFILTETSAGSPICAWEVAKAEELGKPMIPITIGPLTDVTPPAQLAALNYIYFYADPNKPGSGPFAGAKDLESWLRTDLSWTRERTRLTARARQHAENPVDALLMRGEELAEARDWAGRKPDDATIPADVAGYIELSEQSEAALQAKAQADLEAREQALHQAKEAVEKQEEALSVAQDEQKRRRRATVMGLAAALLIGVVGATTTIWSAQRAVVAEQSISYALAATAVRQAETNQYTRAILLSLAADPSGEGSLPLIGADDNPSARAALEHAIVHNRLGDMHDVSHVLEVDDDFGMGDEVTTLAAHPSIQGLYATASMNGMIHVWRAGEDDPVLAIQAHDDFITALDFHPTEPLLVSGSFDLIGRVWNIETGERVFEAIGHEDWIRDVMFLPDGERFITASDDSSAMVWRIGNLDPEVTYNHGPSAYLYAVATNADASLIATGDDYGEVRLWQAGSTEPLQIFTHPEEMVTSLAIHPYWNVVAVGLSDGSVRFWVAGDDMPIAQSQFHSSDVAVTTFDKTGSQFVTASVDGKAAVWQFGGDVPMLTLNNPEPAVSLPHGTEPVIGAAFANSGRLVMTATPDGTLRTWNVGDDGSDDDRRHSEFGLNHLSVGPDGVMYVVGTVDGEGLLNRLGKAREAFVFDGAAAKAMLSAAPTAEPGTADPAPEEIASEEFEEPFLEDDEFLDFEDDWYEDDFALDTEWSATNISSSRFLPDKKHVLTGHEDGSVFLWRVADGQPVRAYDGHPNGNVMSIAISADGRRFLTGSADQSIKLWNVQSGTLLDTFGGHDDTSGTHGASVLSVDFHPGGDYFVSGSADNSARLWRIDRSEEPLDFRGHGDWVRDVAFLPDGQRFLTASDDSTIRLWNTKTPQPLQIYEGHEGWVLTLDVHAEGTYFASGARDGTVRVWRVDQPWPVETFKIANQSFVDVAYLPGTDTLLAASEDGYLRQFSMHEFLRLDM
ncbi:MAG: TIR domain-containing protein, partial [Pseudomonadota bacterium]